MSATERPSLYVIIVSPPESHFQIVQGTPRYEPLVLKAPNDDSRSYSYVPREPHNICAT